MTQSVSDTIERVPIEEALKVGWDGMKKHFWLLLGMTVTTQVPYMICHAIASMTAKQQPFVSLALSLVGMVYLLVCTLGILRATLKIVNQDSIAFSDLFSMVSRTFNYLGATILFLIALTLGFICLIVPGVILAIKLQFYPYFIADKNMGPIAALKASWAVTRDVKLRLFLLYLVCGVVNTIGLLCLILGIIPASMVVMIAQTFVYRRLVETKPETADIPIQSLV